MYLSRLILNPRDRAVRRDLANCHDLHTRIMTAFPLDPVLAGHAREHFGVLYRVETHPRRGSIQLLVQSRVEPDWSRLQQEQPRYLLPEDALAGDPNPACKPVDRALSGIVAGMELVFRLRANPTRRVGGTKDPNDPLRGKRVELQKDEELQDWIRRKGASSGFDVLSVRSLPDPGALARIGAVYGADSVPMGEIPDVQVAPGLKVVGRKGGGADRSRPRLTFGSVVFEGRLRITDAAAFRTALERGIGSGKAYGFGLLSVART